MDVAVAALVLLAAFPVLALSALLIRLEDGGGVLFRQERVGLGGRTFHLLKFRSMRVKSPSAAAGQVRIDNPLVTRVGRVLRRLKIDELPQLWNVIRGDMSLVGPRPTVREQVDGYTPLQRRRLLVRPGMTGWAQVNGNTELDWPERIALDLWYVAHWSLALDLRILLRTVAVVVGGERVSASAVREGRNYAKRADRGG
jgi:lipopolysaccharide/colanic/teichoic acid biosynthesis glycosyltransferase